MDKPIKNKLQKDIQLHRYSFYITIATLVGLLLLKIVQMSIGIDEQEFYKKYPLGWYLVLFLGFSFMGSLIYGVKKSMDTHPNIQLRKKSKEELKSVLDDPDYYLWHDEAQNLLEKKRIRK